MGAGIPFFYVGSGGTNVTQIGVAPFLRYFFGPSKTKPFLGASVGVINTSASGNGSNLASSTNALYSASGGVAFFLNKSVSFNLGLTYTGSNTGVVNTLLLGGANALTSNIPKTINISLGFQVYFGRK